MERGLADVGRQLRFFLRTPMNESYAVGWGTLALINANLAQLKGRSGIGWFLGSLLGGPVATLLLAILDPRPGPGARAG